MEDGGERPEEEVAGEWPPIKQCILEDKLKRILALRRMRQRLQGSAAEEEESSRRNKRRRLQEPLGRQADEHPEMLALLQSLGPVKRADWPSKPLSVVEAGVEIVLRTGACSSRSFMALYDAVFELCTSECEAELFRLFVRIVRCDLMQFCGPVRLNRNYWSLSASHKNVIVTANLCFRALIPRLPRDISHKISLIVLEFMSLEWAGGRETIRARLKFLTRVFSYLNRFWVPNQASTAMGMCVDETQAGVFSLEMVVDRLATTLHPTMPELQMIQK